MRFYRTRMGRNGIACGRPLESWYKDYRDPDGDLRHRFRQDDAHQHDAAWWELYIYTLFRRLGYAVEVHPSVPRSSRRPDFLAVDAHDSVYVECAAAFDGGDSAQADGEAWLKDCINAVPQLQVWLQSSDRQCR